MIRSADNFDKIFQVDEHIGVAISGSHADSRYLINYSRIQAQSFRLTYHFFKTNCLPDSVDCVVFYGRTELGPSRRAARHARVGD